MSPEEQTPCDQGTVARDPRQARLERAILASQEYLLGLCTAADRQDRPLDARAGAAAVTDPGGLAYWAGELEADTTLESDYIFFLYFLDPGAHREKIRKLANYVVSRQLPEGGWNIYPGGPGEISASVKAYLALKLAGRAASDPLMLRAREAILGLGGVERVNSYTKIYLSLLNQVDWTDCPAIPPEIILLPRFFFFNIYEMSYWSRAIVIPLSILFALRPRRDLPPEARIDELFTNGGKNGKKNARRRGPEIPHDPKLFSWRRFFVLADHILKLVERTPLKPLRGLAIRNAEKWIVERLEDSDGLGAIFPAMINAVLAMKSLGYDDNHVKVAGSLQKLRELEIEAGDTIRLQPCTSPVWDTALAINALGESGVPGDHPALVNAVRWMVSKEARQPGDWRVRKADVEASGWYFQYNNEFYPDVDDTAAVLMAFQRCALEEIEGGDAALQRGIEWALSLQCSSGGWAAFDIDVEREILTKIPFADHNAMLDPACADITGRILEMIGFFPAILHRPAVEDAIARAMAFLEREQDESGAWYGRWGVNYVYGTCHALKGLASIGVDFGHTMVRRAADWLESCQNTDGGWGESCLSYDEPSTKGVGSSTASQTAWGLSGLVAAGRADSTAARRAIEYLVDTQENDGSWKESYYTGTGFPCVFYLKYHLYSQYFPLAALGYYRNALARDSAAPATSRKRALHDRLAAGVD